MSSEEHVKVLEDFKSVQEIDKRNMLRLINELPEQCETALGIGRSLALTPLESTPNLVYATGVGDSGLAAQMASASADFSAKVPIIAGRSSRIPAFIGEEALIFIIDYSGQSEFALRSYQDILSRGCNVIVLSSGGRLLEAAIADNVKTIRIPPGQSSRTAIGYLFIPLISAIEGYGLISGAIKQISDAIKLMKNVREIFRFDNSVKINPAKKMAMDLAGKVPVIYGSTGYQMLVSERMKKQINTNAKWPAISGCFCNLLEDEISAWEFAGREPMDVKFVFLRDEEDKGFLSNLIEAATDVIGNSRILDIEIQGANIIEKLMYGIFFADYTSYYLSLVNGVDPSFSENSKKLDELLTGDSDS